MEDLQRERERDSLEGYCSRGGRWRGWSTAKGGRGRKEGAFSHHAQPPARTISNPYLRSATPVERATLVTLPYISFYILFRTALTPVAVVGSSRNPPQCFRLPRFRSIFDRCVLVRCVEASCKPSAISPSSSVPLNFR